MYFFDVESAEELEVIFRTPAAGTDKRLNYS